MQQKTQAIPKNDFKALKPTFTKFAGNIAAINPKMDANKFVESVYHECLINPSLQECDITSILLAAKTAALCGLMVGKIYGQAWLVPYWNSKTRRLDAQFQFGYKGLILLAEKNGITIYPPKAIHENDFYERDEANDNLIHKVVFGKDRGEVIAYYVKYVFSNGLVGFHPMDIAALDKRKEQALAKIKSEDVKKYSPWNTWTEEMYKKTVIKNLFNYLPIDSETRIALSNEDEQIEEKNITPQTVSEQSKSLEKNWYENKFKKEEPDDVLSLLEKEESDQEINLNLETGEVLEEK